MLHSAPAHTMQHGHHFGCQPCVCKMQTHSGAISGGERPLTEAFTSCDRYAALGWAWLMYSTQMLSNCLQVILLYRTRPGLRVAVFSLMVCFWLRYTIKPGCLWIKSYDCIAGSGIVRVRCCLLCSVSTQSGIQAHIHAAGAPYVHFQKHTEELGLLAKQP